jgi:hypothetical protein
VKKEDLSPKKMAHKARRGLVKQCARAATDQTAETYDRSAARLAELRSHLTHGVQADGRNGRKT